MQLGRICGLERAERTCGRELVPGLADTNTRRMVMMASKRGGVPENLLW